MVSSLLKVSNLSVAHTYATYVSSLYFCRDSQCCPQMKPFTEVKVRRIVDFLKDDSAPWAEAAFLYICRVVLVSTPLIASSFHSSSLIML